MDLDTLIQEAAHRAGLSSFGAFRKACQEAGLNVTTAGIHHWWSGLVRPRPEYLPTIASILGVSTHDLCVARVPRRGVRKKSPDAAA